MCKDRARPHTMLEPYAWNLCWEKLPVYMPNVSIEQSNCLAKQFLHFAEQSLFNSVPKVTLGD